MGVSCLWPLLGWLLCSVDRFSVLEQPGPRPPTPNPAWLCSCVRGWVPGSCPPARALAGDLPGTVPSAFPSAELGLVGPALHASGGCALGGIGRFGRVQVPVLLREPGRASLKRWPFRSSCRICWHEAPSPAPAACGGRGACGVCKPRPSRVNPCVWGTQACSVWGVWIGILGLPGALAP